MKVFSIRKILELMGEDINDEILIDGNSYRISSFIELAASGETGQNSSCQALELFVTKTDQHQFDINESISNATNIELFVNGILYISGISNSYHIINGNLIWHGGFILEQSDQIILKYCSIIIVE